ncbi:MAG: hypothetical protein M1812_003590 [Candelaria pacifica]|nr:MAG: hypothetical protein M1812_003590 [Candelaria pacifica]
MPPSESLRNLIVQVQLYEELFKSGSLPYAIPGRYKLRVLKRLLGRIEDSIGDPEEDEISDDLMSCLTALLTTPLPSESASAQDKSHVTYTLPGDPSILEDNALTITLLESRSLISGSGTTGLRTWEAALHLGTFLSSPAGRDHIKGKNVLELGAGTGLLSILCAKHLGAMRVLATDGDEGIVEGLKTNLSLNGLETSTNMEVGLLKWGEPLGDHDHPYAIVLGADIIYDASVVPALVATIGALFARHSAMEVFQAKSAAKPTEWREKLTYACIISQEWLASRFLILYIDLD